MCIRDSYKTALKYDPENLVLWHNLSLCHMQKEDYGAAKEDLGKLLKIAPRYTRAYLMRGEVSLKQKDTCLLYTLERGRKHGK